MLLNKNPLIKSIIFKNKYILHITEAKKRKKVYNVYILLNQLLFFLAPILRVNVV
jgi:hypothetical protein